MILDSSGIQTVHLYVQKRKSENMLQFKKSSDPDFLNSKIYASLNRIETEQVHQRKDLSVINSLLKTLMADIGIQKQVDEFFEKDETSPQTDSNEQ